MTDKLTQQPRITRPELGETVSLDCLKAIISGMEQTFGNQAANVALTATGKLHGKKIAQTYQLNSISLQDAASLQQLTTSLQQILGKNGSRLVIIDNIEQLPPHGYRVFARETVCSADEPIGSDHRCNFTLGVIHGILEVCGGVPLSASQTASVLHNSSHDILEYYWKK